MTPLDVELDDQPVDEERAGRLLYALKKRREDIAQVASQAAAWRAPIDQWETERKGALEKDCAFLVGALERWATAVNDEDPDRKTFPFPWGVVKVRPRQPRLEVDGDEEVLRRLAKVRPGWVRDKPVPDRNAIKSAVKPGDPLDDQTGVPEGYVACWAEVAEKDPETGKVEWLHVAGVVLLEPSSKAVTVTPL